MDIQSRITNHILTGFVVILPFFAIVYLYAEVFSLEILGIWLFHSLIAYGAYRFGRGKLHEVFKENLKKFSLGLILAILIIPISTILVLISIINFSHDPKPI